jgi:ferric-dicitrate binding protein FerR (iron transport regulator)
MTDSPSPGLLARYLSGEASDAERAEVEAWASVPANRREVERLRALWRPGEPGPWNVDAAWQKVSARLDSPPAAEVAAPPAWNGRLLAIAAAAILLFGAALVWRATLPDTPAQVLVVTTGLGERRNVDLPDGTKVLLAPTSELRVAEDYGTTTRRVELDGEAWFVVEHDATRPFLVHAAGTITEDLGTEFLVQELANGAGVQVTLVTGLASLRPEGAATDAATTLAPNDIGLLAPGESVARVVRGTNIGALISWAAGRLEFEDAPLVEVAAALTRWYGSPVILADTALANRRFTGTLHLDALADALEVLRLSLGVAIDRRADTLVVR